MINVNILSVTEMTAIVLPHMEKQRRGLIINISSFSAVYPTPLLSLYAATKNAVDMFSRSLSAEYAGTGILIQSVLPAYVATKMSKIKKPTLMAPSAADYVKSALRTVI
jgi:17beta-estradiol 17-dehydrogenase / very-long-chain 3-oxoacyl-CoA reductase